MAPHKASTEVYAQYSKQMDFKDLEPLLRRSYNDKNLKVLDFEATRLLPPGENYCSIMIKLNVRMRKNDGQEKTQHLVAKTPSPSENAVNIEWPLVFKKELYMYAELRPLYRELDKASGIDDNEVINVWPDYVGYRNSLDHGDKIDYDSLMLLENVKYQGFYTLDKRQGKHKKKNLLLPFKKKKR